MENFVDLVAKKTTCNACRKEGPGYEARLGNPRIHNTMVFALCVECFDELAALHKAVRS